MKYVPCPVFCCFKKLDMRATLRSLRYRTEGFQQVTAEGDGSIACCRSFLSVHVLVCKEFEEDERGGGGGGGCSESLAGKMKIPLRFLFDFVFLIYFFLYFNSIIYGRVWREEIGVVVILVGRYWVGGLGQRQDTEEQKKSLGRVVWSGPLSFVSFFVLKRFIRMSVVRRHVFLGDMSWRILKDIFCF